ncbi:MAG: GH25 family lysozyme [Eubacteriales bacterium]
MLVINIKGIDVSKWQGNIDWNKVKEDGIEFAIIRSSYGRNTSGYINRGVDERFEENYKGAKSVGINVGAYHYCYARNVEQAREEAYFFISRTNGKIFEYPLVLDIEDPRYTDMDNKLVTNIATTFLEILEDAGFFAMIYSYRYFFQKYIDDSMLKPYAHWVAEFDSALDYGGDYGIWQYSSKGSINGINTRVDLDISYIDYARIINEKGLNGISSPIKPNRPSELEFVKEIQSAANAMNYKDKYGRKLGVDGLPGPLTQSMMTKNYLKNGDYNDKLVGVYQKALKELGYYSGEIDNDFGPIMEEAVKEFQKEYDLVVDGLIGPNTMLKIIEVYCI